MNVNSNANNNVVRQRRETEKKSESDSRMLGTEHNGKKYNNKREKIVIPGDSMIKNIKGGGGGGRWGGFRKNCIMQMFMLAIS